MKFFAQTAIGRPVACAVFVAATVWPAAMAQAQGVEDFYKSKPITMLVGSGAGGGYDVYARAFARFWTNHIPGHPNIIAKNMPAAAGLAAASTLYNSAERDGSAIGAFTNGAAMDPLFGNPSARYDAQKFNWLGSIGKLENVCATWHTSPVKTIAAAQAREVIVSAAGATSNTRHRAENAQRPDRHQVQGHLRLRHRLRPHHVGRARRGGRHLRPVVVDHEGVAPALDQGQAAQRHRADGPCRSCATCPTCRARSISSATARTGRCWN